MIGSFKAALCAAVAVCATPACAAEYLTYKITTVGTGTLVTGRTFDEIKTVNLVGYDFSFSFPLAAVTPATSGETAGVGTSFKTDLGYIGGGGGATAQGTDLSIVQNESYYSGPGLSLSIRACLASSVTAFPLGAISVVPNCGNVAFEDRGNGYRTNYTGSVTSIVGVLSQENPGPGLQSAIAVIPEPSTWAMMLVGFGLVAGAARYRRRSMTITSV